MLVTELFLSIAFCLLISYLIKKRKFLELASKIPGPKNHIPLIGVLPEFVGADLKKIFKIFMKYQNCAACPGKVWFGTELMIMINTPDAIQKVLNSKECLDKPKFFNAFRLQNASLFGTLDAWRSHRKILNPAFGIQILKTFIPLFDESSKKLIKILEKQSTVFDVFPHMSAFFLETILKAALDLDVDIQNDSKKDEYLKYYEDYLLAITTRMTKIWLHFEPIYKMTKYYTMEMEARSKSSLKFTEEILQRGRHNAEVSQHIYGPKNAIKSLMNPKYELKDQEIREEITSIIMAGQETTAITVSTVLLMLAMHKSVQEKVVRELREILPTADAPIDNEILNKLTYLEMVIKETMRLFPVAAFTLRTTTENFELNKFTIPAGSNLFLSLFALHRDQKYWGDDAESFMPERFEADRIKSVHPYAYLPFTGGPRICLGWRYAMLFMKTCLANFLRNFEVDTTLKYDELEFEVAVTLKINQPYSISLVKRFYDSNLEI